MIVGQMALYNFPLMLDTVSSFAQHCDALYLIYDVRGDLSLISKAAKHPKVASILPFTPQWNRFNWREQMIRMLDEVEPEMVLCLDEDEEYGNGLDRDLEEFRATDRKMLFFDYEMVTEDGREVPKYPGGPHCKGYKWEPGITYIPYRGNAIPDTFRANKDHWFRCTSKIQHYCFYTSEMQAMKVLHL